MVFFGKKVFKFYVISSLYHRDPTTIGKKSIKIEFLFFPINKANSSIIFTDSKRALKELSHTYLFLKTKFWNCTTGIPQKSKITRKTRKNNIHFLPINKTNSSIIFTDSKRALKELF
jgi:hypothetical protein